MNLGLDLLVLISRISKENHRESEKVSVRCQIASILDGVLNILISKISQSWNRCCKEGEATNITSLIISPHFEVLLSCDQLRLLLKSPETKFIPLRTYHILFLLLRCGWLLQILLLHRLLLILRLLLRHMLLLMLVLHLRIISRLLPEWLLPSLLLVNLLNL